MEAGITKVITAAYPVMKITCVSLQWKREYICNYCDASSDENSACFIATEAGITESYYCNVSRDENNACFIAMEAGELILFFHTYSSMKITRVRVDNEISSSNFECNENRIIFIGENVSTIGSVHPTSIAMKLALFAS